MVEFICNSHLSVITPYLSWPWWVTTELPPEIRVIRLAMQYLPCKKVHFFSSSASKELSMEVQKGGMK